MCLRLGLRIVAIATTTLIAGVGVTEANSTSRALAQGEDHPPELSPPPEAQRQQYQTQGIIFETPFGYSPLQSMGGTTTGVFFPATANQTRRVAVRLLELKPSALGLSGLGPVELSEYVRFRFWGLTTSPQSHQTRRFMGQSVVGDVLMQPQNGGMSYLEFYLVPLTAERQLAIAFETDTELPVGLLEELIQSVSASLREDPTLKSKPSKSSSFSP